MGIRTLLSWTAFPLLLGGAVLLSHVLVTLGFSGSFSVFWVTFAAAFPLLLMQLRMPADEEWRGRPRDFGLDLLHMVSTGLTGDLWRAISFGVSFAVAAWLSAALGMTLWPTEWPILAQFALAMVVGDFGAYWVHRSCHTFPLMWRVHAMHHSSERLYVFSATRNHPVNVVLAWGSQALPLIVLGASEHVLVLMSVFTAVHGMLQHANIDLKHGWLNHLFATADLHRWHHSAKIEESNSNYGSNLIIWDWVFGTRLLPDDRAHPDRLGLEGYAMPENWFSHLASPFILRRYETDEIELSDLPAIDDFTLENRPVEGERPQPVAP
ncbi:MAG: sterol desaturase family protein [Alphaproteobacteria bacterium]|nr:sterol desaturase family protein [Alphaproteobacteria bacterium]